MDNLTHSFVGLAAAKAGLDRFSPAATTLCVLAANAPDSDIGVLLVGDRWTYLHHHRGITHAVVGAITLAVVLPLLFYGIDVLIARWKQRQPQLKLGGLFVASFITTATHPLLDWMNNYGVRPLLPWNPQWVYGDLIYIVDPFLWLLFGGASFLLTSNTRFRKIIWGVLGILLTLLVAYGPARRQDLPNPRVLLAIWIAAVLFLVLLFILKSERKWGAKIAITAFVFSGIYFFGLTLAHRSAVGRAEIQAADIAGLNGETVSKLAVMPTLANPLSWVCTFKTDKATYRFVTNLFENTNLDDVIRYPVPTGELAAAMQQVGSERSVRVFLDFARFPVARLKETDCTSQTLLQLADLRYTEPGSGRTTFALELPVNCQSLEARR